MGGKGSLRPKIHFRGLIIDVLDTIFFVVAVFVLVEIAMPRFMVDGRSMQPTFFDGQRLIISRLEYMISGPSRGNIVIFNSPASGPDDPPLIKRAIGLPGDTIEIRDTLVYVNGELLDEPYINEACRPTMCPDNQWILGEDEYFFMGDNRNNSNDSRRFGPVKSSAIIGEAIVRYWPLSDLGIVYSSRFPSSE